jgi:heat shock protein HtpX
MTLYAEIGRNNRTTLVLFLIYSLFYGLVFATFLIVVGFQPDLPLFTLTSVFLLLIFYFIIFPRAPQMVLSVTGARELKKKEDPYLYNVVEGLAIGAGIPMPKIYVIESEALNAFATGIDPNHSYVAITSALRKKLNRLELEGVLAHEMSHIKNFDIRTMLVASMFAMAIALLANLGLRMMWTRSSSDDRKNGGGAVFAIAIVFLFLAPIISLLMRLAISRNREYAADASGAMLTRYPPGLASALEKIKTEYEKKPVQMKGANDATRHLFIFDPMKRQLMSLLSTHPDIDDRIKRLKAM